MEAVIQSHVGARMHINLAAELGQRCVLCGISVSIMKPARLKESWRDEAGLESPKRSKETLGKASVALKAPDY